MSKLDGKFERVCAAAWLAVGLCLVLTGGCSGKEEETKPDASADVAGDVVEADGLADAVDVGSDGESDAGDAGPTDVGDTVNADTGGGGGALLSARSLQFSESFRGVWGSSAQDVWWVGSGGRLLHDNGKTLVPRDSGTKKDLYAVWGRGPNDVVIAGEGTLLHWNGKKLFNKLPKGMENVVLRTIHSPADGSTLLVAGDDGIILRLVDGDFVQETTGSALQIHALRAINAGNVWAVGAKGQGLRLNGGSWTSFSMPGAAEALTGLDVTKSGKLMACGLDGFLATTEEKAWTATLSNDPKNRDLYGMWAIDDVTAFAIGKDGALVELGGAKWGLRDLDDATYMKTATFRAIFGFSGKDGTLQGFAVGDKGSGLRYDGASDKWFDKRAETSANLLSVRALADGRVIAVGGGGVLLQAADARAPLVDLHVDVTATDLYDVCDDGAGGLLAVGDGGVVVRLGKTGPAEVTTPAAASGLQLRGVAKVGNAIVAVGVGGVAMAWVGGTWKAENSGTQMDLESVTAVGDVALAVGAFGTVLRRGKDGVWAKESSGTSTPLHRVVGAANGEAAAVGDNGVILLRKADGTWSVGFEQPGLFLFGVERLADGRVVAVGWQGSLVVGKAGAFQVRTSGVNNVLRGVAVSGKLAVAVGHKGGVYDIAEGL